MGQSLHGESLLPLIQGNGEWDRAMHYAEYHGDWYGHYSARMVTDGRWKLVWNLTDLCELYDLEKRSSRVTQLFLRSRLRGGARHLLRLYGDRGETYRGRAVASVAAAGRNCCERNIGL